MNIKNETTSIFSGRTRRFYVRADRWLIGTDSGVKRIVSCPWAHPDGYNYYGYVKFPWYRTKSWKRFPLDFELNANRRETKPRFLRSCVFSMWFGWYDGAQEKIPTKSHGAGPAWSRKISGRRSGLPRPVLFAATGRVFIALRGFPPTTTLTLLAGIQTVFS